MKKLLLLVLAFNLMIFANAFSQRPTTHSELTIHSWDRAFMQVTIQDRIYDAPNGAFSISGLRPGNHHIIIARRIGNRGLMQEVYRGNLHIPRSTHLVASLSRHNRLIVQEKYVIDRTYAHRRRQHDPYYDDRRYETVNVPSVVHAMERSAFEKDKLIIAKQALRHNRIDAAGVERIMRQLAFESSRLEFAMYAYEYCIDPQNYYRVNNAFSFNSSVRKLDEHINSLHNSH